MSRNSFFSVAVALVMLSGRCGAAPPATAQPKPNVIETAPTPPQWLAPFRLRYALHIPGVRKRSAATSVVVQLPTGGRLRPDAGDVAVQTIDGERLPVTVLSHDPKGGTILQFPRHGDDSWYFAYAVAGNVELPTSPTPSTPPAQEGLTVEIRRWAGEDINDWAAVREGLTSSENVIGNAVVAEVIENCNPSRPNDPRNYASSYRGYLNIPADGVYRFFLNAEDAAFLFIDGYKVTERVGTNARLTGAVKVRDIGDDVELKAGVHPFEVHHVMGNNPTAIGYCAMMWVPPDAKAWAYVPHKTFVHADVARVAAIDEVEQKPAPAFVYGIDDTLRSADGGLVYLLQFAAVGALPADEATIRWDFGDGTSARGARPTHVYFQAGDFEVTVAAGDLPAYRTNVHVWPAPGNTSPLSLGKTLASLRETEWQKFDADRLNRMFQFLTVCEQPDRWALIDAVATKLLTDPSLDLKQKVFIHRTRMESLAYQGKADEAIQLGEQVLGEFGRVPSLQVGIKLEMATIYHRHLKKLDEAAARYEKICNENRRVEHPDVRVAAIRWGDLYAETGDLRRAGECYRLANALGGESFESSSLTGTVTRGGLLRTAEQKLRAGDIQQTRQLLERIELNYPEEKLEGLYRVLRAEADRRTGRYEEALRNYEIVLKLTQWSGFHDRAMLGLADTYFRLGELPRSLQWLDSLEKTYPRFYETQKLAEFRKLVTDRQTRLAAAGDGAAHAGFHDLVFNFEPDEEPWGELTSLQAGPGLGIHGPHVAVGTNFPQPVGYLDLHRKLAALDGGEYWLELWIRDYVMSLPANPHMHMALFDEKFSKELPTQGTTKLDRSLGVWRRHGFPINVPATAVGGSTNFSVRLVTGFVEIDGYSVRAIEDRQSDALNNFLKGSDVE